MQSTSLDGCWAVRGVMMIGTFTSVASAQNQTWIQQLGTSADDRAFGLAADGSTTTAR